MPSEYDGSIKLGVEFDVKSVKQSANDLKKSVENALSSMDGKQLNKNMLSLKNSMEKVLLQANAITDKMKELESMQVPTNDYIEITEQLEKANKKYNDLLYKQQQLIQDPSVNVTSARWQKVVDQIEEVANEIRFAEGELEDLVETGKAFKLGSETDEYDKLAKKLDDVNSRMKILNTRHEELNISEEKSSTKLKIFQSILSSIGKVIKTAGSYIKQFASHLFSLVKASIVNGLRRIGNAIHSIGASSRTSQVSVKGLLRTLFAYGLGMQGLVTVFNRLRGAIGEGLQNLAAMNNGVNLTNMYMSEFTSSLNYLKNSVAAAFLPIIQVVQPILTGFIDKLAQSINYIGAFIRALRGFSTYTKANKVEKQYYQANSTAKQENAKTTGKTTARTNANTRANLANTKAQTGNTKAVKTNTNALKKQRDVLAGFDDLDVLGQEEDSENVLDPLTNAADNLPISPSNLSNALQPSDVAQPIKDAIDAIDDALKDLDNIVEEHADIPDWIKNLVDRIKDFIAREDWYGLGEFLGQKFNYLLHIIDDWFNNVLRPEGVKWARNIAEFFNGLVAGIDWELLGKTLADGLNALADIINTFLTTFDFLEFGKGIGRAIKSWFDNIEWDLIGQTFANGWNALFHTIEGIVTTEGIWESIGTSIATFLRNAIETIDIDSLATIFIAVFNGIFDMLRAFLDENPFQGLAVKIYTALNRMIHEIDWVAAGQTLSDFVIQLLDVFMLVAEQTDWEGFGRAIGEFLSNIDWAGVISRVGTILWEVFSGMIKGLFDTDAGKVFLALVAGIGGLKLAFSLGAAILLPAIQTLLIDKVAALLVGGLGGAAAETAVATEAGMVATEAAVATGGAGILGTLSGILSTITAAIAAFVAFLFTPEGLLLAGLAFVLTGIVLDINQNWDTISAKLEDIGDWLGNLWDSLVTAFRENFTMGIIDELKDMVNTGIKMIEDFVNGIIAGINMAIYALNSLSFDVPDWVPLLGGQHLGFNIPYINSISIPKLAQGAVIPPNKQFLAMLGDQKSGTNIEAPLDTIVDAFRQVVGNMQVQNTGYSEMVLDGQVFARLATPYVISELSRQGYDVKVLEG